MKWYFEARSSSTHDQERAELRGDDDQDSRRDRCPVDVHSVTEVALLTRSISRFPRGATKRMVDIFVVCLLCSGDKVELVHVHHSTRSGRRAGAGDVCIVCDAINSQSYGPCGTSQRESVSAQCCPDSKSTLEIKPAASDETPRLLELISVRSHGVVISIEIFSRLSVLGDT